MKAETIDVVQIANGGLGGLVVWGGEAQKLQSADSIKKEQTFWTLSVYRSRKVAYLFLC